MAYTPSVLMLTNYKGTTQLEKIKQGIPALLKQTNENSIVSTAVFKKMQKGWGYRCYALSGKSDRSLLPI